MTDTFQWRRCDAADPGDGSTCADIGGATASTYLLTAGDVGHRLQLTGARDGVPAIPSALTPVISPAPSPPGPTDQKFGFSSGQGPYTLSDTSMDLNRWFAAQQSMHTTLVRASYGAGEESSGQISRIIAAATAHGVEVQLCFASTTDPATIRAAVAKYRPLGVLKFEGFNEANIRSVTPATWRSQNNAMHDAAKAAASDCVWVSAALCPYGQYGSTGPGHWDAQLYLEQALALGPLSFDRFGFHPYPVPSTSADAMMNMSNTSNGLAQIASFAHSIVPTLVAHGITPIIDATEVGVSTAAGQSNESGQAGLITQLIPWWQAQSWAGDMMIYSVYDHPGDTSKEGRFGVLRPDWSEKPSATALRAALA